MRSMRIVSATLLALSLPAGACSKDVTGPTISLSRAEVVLLATDLFDLQNATPTSLRAGSSAAFSIVRGPRFLVNLPVDVTVTCPGTGTASTTGNVDSTSTTLNVDLTLTFNACKTTHFTTGGSFRVTGAATVTQTAFSLQATLAGTLSVKAADGRSGACGINVQVTASASPTVPETTTVSGTACGVSVNGTY